MTSPRNTDLPPELRAMNAAMDAVFGAINAAPQAGLEVDASTLDEIERKSFGPAVAAPLDGSDGVVERGPVRSTKPWLVVRRRALATRVLVVARTRIEGTWAAYCDAVPGMDHDQEQEAVLAHGDKLSESVAVMLFPEFNGMPYAP